MATIKQKIDRSERLGTICGAVLVFGFLFLAIGILAAGLMLFGTALGFDGLAQIGSQVTMAGLGAALVAFALSGVAFVVGMTIIDIVERKGR